VENTFSVCILYRNQYLFDKLVAELKCNGFVKEVELIAINNAENAWDSYRAIRYFIEKSQTDYVLICHEDIEFKQLTFDQLTLAVQSAVRHDERAAVFGVAGISRKSNRGCGHFYSKRGEEKWGIQDHGRAISLDECFLVIRKNSGVTVSEDLSGFHFYGADLCINSERAGFTNYVIEYPIAHYSEGTLDGSFFKARDAFEEHLKVIDYRGFIQTTCTFLYGGQSSIKRGFSLAVSLLMVKNTLHKDFQKSLHALLRRGYKLYGKNSFNFFLLFARYYIYGRKVLGNIHFIWSYIIVGIIYWKVLYPVSWPVRRLVGDIQWWSHRILKKTKV
jgi:hypothetical protein